MLGDVGADGLLARARDRAARLAQEARRSRGRAGAARGRAAGGPAYSSRCRAQTDRERHLGGLRARRRARRRAGSAPGSSRRLWTMNPVSSASPSCSDRVRVAARAGRRARRARRRARARAHRLRPGPQCPFRSTAIRISNRYSHGIEQRLSTTLASDGAQQPTRSASAPSASGRRFWSRLAGLVAVIVPPVGLVVGTVLLWNHGVNWVDLAVLAVVLRPVRARDHGRLAPLLLAQELRDRPRA